MIIRPESFYLQSEDLKLDTEDEFTLVFFFSNTCHYCVDAEKLFNYSFRNIQDVTHLLYDVETDNYVLPRVSMQSKFPITHVPLLVMFYKGSILDVFDSDNSSLEQFISFITRCKNSVTTQSNSTIARPLYSVGVPKNKTCPVVIPKYSLGKPSNLHQKRYSKQSFN